MIDKQSHKLVGLEVLRFLSALSILFWHYQHFWPQHADRALQPFYPALHVLYDYGFYGVRVFWCISGFIFFWKYRDPIAERKMTPRTFFVLRFSRLYPLHLATLLLVAVLQAVYWSKEHAYYVFPFNGLKDFILQLFFASNWFTGHFSFNGPVWSISIEILVYVTFLLSVRRAGKTALLNLLMLLYCVAAGFPGAPNAIIHCFAFFYAGGFSALLFDRYGSTHRNRLLVRLAVVAAIIPLLLLWSGAALLKLLPQFGLDFTSVTFISTFLVVYVPIVLYLAAQDFPLHPLARKALETAGNMTYASYLIHFPLQLVIVLCFLQFRAAIPYDSASFLAAFLCLTFFASFFIYRFFESPAQAFLRRKLKAFPDSHAIKEDIPAGRLSRPILISSSHRAGATPRPPLSAADRACPELRGTCYK